MFSRKDVDNKKHPFREKESRRPKLYKKVPVVKFVKDAESSTQKTESDNG